MTAQWAKIGVDTLVILHFAFVLFVLFGAVLLLRWRKLMWLHIPALAWGILVELNGWLCPLTSLENRLREIAGLGMYQGDFVMHYLMPILYPVDLTRSTQLIFGTLLAFINLLAYGYVFRHQIRRLLEY